MLFKALLKSYKRGKGVEIVRWRKQSKLAKLGKIVVVGGLAAAAIFANMKKH